MSKSIILIALLALIGSTIATTCKDGSACPGVSTCCLMAAGRVGCCPYENASCCGDGLHCCPSGFNCSAVATCVRSEKNEFLVFLNTPVLENLTPSIMVNETSVQVKGIAEILKCIYDIKPVSSDIMALIASYRKGDMDAVEKLILQLGVDGYALSADCMGAFAKLQN